MQYFCIKLIQTNKQKRKKINLVAIISAVEMKEKKKEAVRQQDVQFNSSWEKWEVTCNPKPFPPEAEALPAGERADGRLHFARPQRLCCLQRHWKLRCEPGPALFKGHAQRASHFLWIPLR